jgi:WD40 repeat protein
MKKIMFLLLAVFLFAFNKIEYKSYISKITFDKNYLIVGLENGDVVIKNFKNLKNIYTIHLPKIHDFMDEEIAMPIYSMDIRNNQLLILAGGEESSRELFGFDLKSKKLIKIFHVDKSLMQLKFLDKNRVLFATLSDELLIYDLKNRKFTFSKQVGKYVFSKFVLNGNLVAVGDESGKIDLFNLKTKQVKNISGNNKDKTISLDFKNNLILNASSDMRIGVYDINGNQKLAMKVKFLPYGASLSKNKFAVQYDEKNDIVIFDMNKNLIKLLKGHTMPLNGMKFINENELLSFSPNEIIIWKIKE